MYAYDLVPVTSYYQWELSAAGLITNPNLLLAGVIEKEVAAIDINAFSQSVQRGHELGLINARLVGFVQANARKLNDANAGQRAVHHSAPAIRRPRSR